MKLTAKNHKNIQLTELCKSRKWLLRLRLSFSGSKTLHQSIILEIYQSRSIYQHQKYYSQDLSSNIFKTLQLLWYEYWIMIFLEPFLFTEYLNQHVNKKMFLSKKELLNGMRHYLCRRWKMHIFSCIIYHSQHFNVFLINVNVLHENEKNIW